MALFAACGSAPEGPELAGGAATYGIDGAAAPSAAGSVYALRASLPVRWDKSLAVHKSDDGATVVNDFLLSAPDGQRGELSLRLCGMHIPPTRPTVRRHEPALFVADGQALDGPPGVPPVTATATRQGDRWATAWVGVEVGVRMAEPDAVAWPTRVADLLPTLGRAVPVDDAHGEGLRMVAATHGLFRMPITSISPRAPRIREMRLAIRNVLRFEMSLPPVGEGAGWVEARPDASGEREDAGGFRPVCLNALTLACTTNGDRPCDDSLRDRVNAARPLLRGARGTVRTLALPHDATCQMVRARLGPPPAEPTEGL